MVLENLRARFQFSGEGQSAGSVRPQHVGGEATRAARRLSLAPCLFQDVQFNEEAPVQSGWAPREAHDRGSDGWRREFDAATQRCGAAVFRKLAQFSQFFGEGSYRIVLNGKSGAGEHDDTLVE